jgi:hypothetical protein
VTVFGGESLAQVATDSGFSPQQLLGLTQGYIVNPNQIFPGDQIYLPGTG